VEVQDRAITGPFQQRFSYAAPARSLGFGSGWHTDCASYYLRKEEPAMVPATEGVSMRSVALGGNHAFVLTNEGQLYMWGSISKTSAAPDVPTIFEEAKHLN
jgi:hypothetical protein